MVSALNGLGVKDMVRSLKDDMGFRADLWVVGAQNGEHEDTYLRTCGQRLCSIALFTCPDNLHSCGTRHVALPVQPRLANNWQLIAD